MGIYLNSRKSGAVYRNTSESLYFVDKSAMLGELCSDIEQGMRYLCVTRPRRFGKTVIASMIASFFGRGQDSSDIFFRQKIASCRNYAKHLNRHHVIYIMMNEIPDACHSYDAYIARIRRRLVQDLLDAFPGVCEREDSLWDILNAIYEAEGAVFIFVLDEWDYIYHQDWASEQDKTEYTRFLSVLLKDQPYVEMAYMTGILPISKYSSGSELNMFCEYTMVSEGRFSEYFGFTEKETDDLYARYLSLRSSAQSVTRKGVPVRHNNATQEGLNPAPQNVVHEGGSASQNVVHEGSSAPQNVTREDLYTNSTPQNVTHEGDSSPQNVTREGLRFWYDGYHTKSGIRVYNPRSVVLALTNNNLGNYWTNAGPYDELFYYIRANVDAVRDDVGLMLADIPVPAKVQEYAATSRELRTRDEIFSAMVVYGFLNYENGCVSIPNHELKGKFSDMVQKEPSMGNVYRLARESYRMLQATKAADTQTMEEILSFAHNTESPLNLYNRESELTLLIKWAYLSAIDYYRIEREDKAGRGYADFIFYPYTPVDDAIILELKIDSSPEEALAQIRSKGYALIFEGKPGEKPICTGRVLGVGISYSRTDPKRRYLCRVEVLRSALQ